MEVKKITPRGNSCSESKILGAIKSNNTLGNKIINSETEERERLEEKLKKVLSCTKNLSAEQLKFLISFLKQIDIQSKKTKNENKNKKCISKIFSSSQLKNSKPKNTRHIRPRSNSLPSIKRSNSLTSDIQL